MTYGENATRIRTELTTLLRQHRVQQRLGGRGTYRVPETTTIEQRRETGELIQRYRWATLMWCLQAVVAADPRADPNAHVSASSRGPVDELRHRLTKSLSEMTMPLFEELTTPQTFPLVDGWRQVAKAAALGEHDFANGVGHGRLSRDECLTVLADAAEITRAVVILDKRYDQIPGWRCLRGAAALERAAKACAAFAHSEHPDYAADGKGWRAPSALIEGGPLPGIGGVLQAEHNMLVHLSAFPNALNLRRVIDGQRILSRDACRLAKQIAPELVCKWSQREATYQSLVYETRNLGGLIGTGAFAAAEASFAVSRLRSVHADDLPGPDPLRDLDKLFARSDARIATIIEQGASERLYFAGSEIPRSVSTTDPPLNSMRETYAPISGPVAVDLLEVVRRGLEPARAPISPASSTASREARQELRQAIGHRAERRPGRAR